MSDSEPVSGESNGDALAVEQLREAYSVAENEEAQELIAEVLCLLTEN